MQGAVVVARAYDHHISIREEVKFFAHAHKLFVFQPRTSYRRAVRPPGTGPSPVRVFRAHFYFAHIVYAMR